MNYIKKKLFQVGFLKKFCSLLLEKLKFFNFIIMLPKIFNFSDIQPIFCHVISLYNTIYPIIR